MTAATDIPLWTYVEGLGLESLNGDGEELKIDADVLKQMFLHSPIAKVGDVITPSLVSRSQSESKGRRCVFFLFCFERKQMKKETITISIMRWKRRVTIIIHVEL